MNWKDQFLMEIIQLIFNQLVNLKNIFYKQISKKINYSLRDLKMPNTQILSINYS